MLSLVLKDYQNEYMSKEWFKEINTRREITLNMLKKDIIDTTEILENLANCYKVEIRDFREFYQSLFASIAKFGTIKTEILGIVNDRETRIEVIVWHDMANLKDSYAIEELTKLIRDGHLIVVGFLNQDKLVDSIENLENARRLEDITITKALSDISNLGLYSEFLSSKIISAILSRNILKDLALYAKEMNEYCNNLDSSETLIRR